MFLETANKIKERKIELIDRLITDDDFARYAALVERAFDDIIEVDLRDLEKEIYNLAFANKVPEKLQNA